MNGDSDNHIIEALRRTRFARRPQREEQILADATAAMAGRASAGATAPRRRWPGLMRKAAAILLPLGVLLAVVAYLDRPTLTLAQVSDAYAKQTWVHIKYDNGREEWLNLRDGRRFFRDHDGRTVYTEPDGLRLWWWANGSHISKDKWYIGEAPPPRPRNTTPWDAFVAPYQQASTRPAEGDRKPTVERHEDTLDGREVVRFDWHLIDVLGRRLLIQQMWADPHTRLPVQRREVLQLGERQKQKREAIVGRYDFPATGPSTIHDIGVPRGLPVLDADAKPSEEVAAVLAAGEAARRRWPVCYRLLVWEPDDRMGAVDHIYREGRNFAHTRYFVSPQPGVPDFPSPATLQKVLEWVGSRTPVEQLIDDGERRFRRTNNVYNQLDMPPARVRVMPSPDFPDDSNLPPGTHWPYLNVEGAPRRVEPPSQSPQGIIVLRREYGDGRTDYWIDPAHDHIALRTIRQKKTDGQWRNEWIDYLEDLKQLPTGQWYASRRRQEIYLIRYQQTGQPQLESEAVDINVLEAHEIPPGTFDGKKLLEGATVETY